MAAGGRRHGDSHPPPTAGPRPISIPRPQISGFRGAFSLLLFPQVLGVCTSPSCSRAFSNLPTGEPREPGCTPAPAHLTVTHSALQRLVVGGEGEDDHSTQIGDHIDVEGYSPKLAPFVTQKFVDGFHGQHLMAVLWEAGWLGTALPMDRLTLVCLPTPSALTALSPPKPFFSNTRRFTGDLMGVQTPRLSIWGSAQFCVNLPFQPILDSYRRTQRWKAILMVPSSNLWIVPASRSKITYVACQKYKSLGFNLRNFDSGSGIGKFSLRVIST